MTDCIFRSLVLHAFTKIWGGDACDLCVVCFGAEHAQPALEKKKKKRGLAVHAKNPYCNESKCALPQIPHGPKAPKQKLDL